MGAVQVPEDRDIEMRILYRENLLCIVDKIPEQLRVGSVIRVGGDGALVRVEYLDRERNEIGILPIGDGR